MRLVSYITAEEENVSYDLPLWSTPLLPFW
nr:MAG TPA: beta-sandwich protein [Caudoviricetes sp.]